MPIFEPFRAIRYVPSTNLAAVTAPPYDVLSVADVDALEAQDPHNIVRIDVPRGGPDRYADAATTFQGWLADGVLVVDDAPTLTVYRRRFTDATGQERELSGVLGALEVADEGSREVLAHERTTPKASTDRLELTRATEANLSPVWCLSAYPGLTDLLAEPGEPVGTLAADGVEHRVERVVDPARIAAICTAVAAQPALIADGHHRYAVSRQYRDEVRRSTGRTDTAAERTLAFVGELVADQLSVEAIHRLYTGVDPDVLASRLSSAFTLEPGGRLDALTPDLLARMHTEGRLVLVRPSGWEWMTPRSGVFDGIRALDGLWLERTLEGSAADVTYQHGLTEVAAAVQDGRAAAAVLIRPVSVEEIQRTAEEGLLMPPKSTYFTPKLQTGLVLRAMS
ncbi:MAG: DUF1015 domain-containing protein [Lapillicoccus sp.]